MTLSLSKYLYIIYYFRQMVKYFVIIFNYIENKVNDVNIGFSNEKKI